MTHLIAVDDNVTVTEDVLATGNVLTNDTDPEGDTLTAFIGNRTCKRYSSTERRR